MKSNSEAFNSILEATDFINKTVEGIYLQHEVTSINIMLIHNIYQVVIYWN